MTTREAVARDTPSPGSTLPINPPGHISGQPILPPPPADPTKPIPPPIDGGWGIIDFWESREAFDAFATGMPEGMAAAGLTPQGPPDIKEFPVHETIAA